MGAKRDRIALEKKKWEAEQQSERQGGRWVGNASGRFVPASGLEAQRVSDSAMAQAAMADRGLTERNKYSTDAETGWRGREQQEETSRANLKERGLTSRGTASNENLLEQQRLRNKGGLAVAGLDEKRMTREQEQEKRKVFMDRIQAYTAGQKDENGFLIPGSQLTPGEALERILHEDRLAEGYMNPGAKEPPPEEKFVRSPYDLGAGTRGMGGIDTDPRSVKPGEPLGSDFLQTNLGVYSGLNAAAKLNNKYINQPLSNIWGASTKLGEGMISAGSKLADFLGRKYK